MINGGSRQKVNGLESAVLLNDGSGGNDVYHGANVRTCASLCFWVFIPVWTWTQSEILLQCSTGCFRFRLKTEGDGAFLVRAPRLWNSLPEGIRLSQSAPVLFHFSRPIFREKLWFCGFIGFALMDLFYCLAAPLICFCLFFTAYCEALWYFYWKLLPFIIIIDWALSSTTVLKLPHRAKVSFSVGAYFDGRILVAWSLYKIWVSIDKILSISQSDSLWIPLMIPSFNFVCTKIDFTGFANNLLSFK